MVLNDLKQNIINMLNESHISIDAIYYVVREVMQEVEAAYNRVLEEEKAQAAQQPKIEEVKEEEPTAESDSKVEEKADEENKNQEGE